LARARGRADSKGHDRPQGFAMSTMTALAGAPESGDALHFLQLVRDYVELLDAQWRSRLSEAADAEFIRVTPAEAQNLLKVIDWLAAAVARKHTSRKEHLELVEHDAPLPSDEADPRDRFIAMLAHDLRTPLNAIALTAAAELRCAEGKDRRCAARVLGCAERMKRMIADLLDFAQARVGPGLPVRPERFDLRILLGEIVREIEDGHPGASVLLEGAAEILGAWDRGRIAQALSNLVSNAVHHRQPPQTPVHVRLSRQGDGVVIAVVNRSDPIPDSEIPRLFEPFERGPSSRCTRGSVGLGLFIVREIVVAHGGEVRAYNSPDEGTVTFCVALPLHCTPRA
jgi:signal transduction histidine kinase